jgi:hypothetical protein
VAYEQYCLDLVLEIYEGNKSIHLWNQLLRRTPRVFPNNDSFPLTIIFPVMIPTPHNAL